MKTHVLRLIAPLAVVLMLAGCALATRSPKIAELRYNPARYHDKTVSVTGVVTSSWGVPLVPIKLYKIDDGTGELTVVASGGRVPTRGARVRVKGKVQEVATVGGQAVGLHLQQQSLDVKGW